MVFDKMLYPIRLNRPGFISWFLWVLCLCSSHALFSQNPSIHSDDIHEFARILKTQNEVAPLSITDLSNKNFIIYWLYPDRRSADAFLERIAWYVGDTYARIIFRWSWPDTIISSDDQIPIVIYGSGRSWPDRFYNDFGFRIKIGPADESDFNGLQLPRFGTGTADLAAQYIMNGITLDEEGKIRTGKRVSFLPADYFGLDGAYIRKQLDSILQSGLDSAAYPGAEVAIAYKGSVIYQNAVGYHTYAKNYPVRMHDLYDLASVTKVVSGVNALMIMYENNKFDLDKTLADYFPTFKNSDKGGLTMKRILTHSAGLIPYMVYYNMINKENGRYIRNTLSPVRHGNFTYPVTDSIYASDRFYKFIFEAIKDSPLKPGHEYVYSGLFFQMIGQLVKNQTDESLKTLLYDRVFKPMGARNTGFNPVYSFNIHQIVPTEVDRVWRHQLVHGKVHDEAAAVLGGVSANAGLFSAGSDLIKIGETWRRNGSYGGKMYWTPETINTFTKCYYCDEGNRRALGFDRPLLPDVDAESYMSSLASQESFGHSGFTGTMIWVDPSKDYTFVFLSNRVHPTRDNTKLYSLDIRPNLHSVLYKAINRDN